MQNVLQVGIPELKTWEKLAILVIWDDWQYYLAHKKEHELSLHDANILSTWAHDNQFSEDHVFRALPSWKESIKVILWSNLSATWPVLSVTNRVDRLSREIRFDDGDLNGNFEKLRALHWLGTDDHISSILTSYTLTFKNGASATYIIPNKDSSKPWILLLTLAGNADEFELSGPQRAIVYRYFWSDICERREKWNNEKYIPIANVLVLTNVRITLNKVEHKDY